MVLYNILTIYNVFFSYAGSESVYGGVDIEEVRHVWLWFELVARYIKKISYSL